MDRLLTYRPAIATPLNEYAQLRRRHGSVQAIAICDPTTDNYLLINLGWKNSDRIHDIVIHLRIINQKIHVEWNGTDRLIGDLGERGIPENAFISATVADEIDTEVMVSMQSDRPLAEA
ncbi:MAG: element excision factor XisI family protein [Cyanophyceae cyanobacterium]